MTEESALISPTEPGREHERPAARPHVAPKALGIYVAAISVTSILIVLVAARWLRPPSPVVFAVQVAPALAATAPRENVPLSVRGYILAHHRTNVNSKVTGRISWVGVEKGDHVAQGQILVKLEDDEFQAQVRQAEGALANAQAYLQQLQAGPRPEEVRRAEHSLEQARVSMLNDKDTLDRTTKLAAAGVLPRETLDNVRAKFESSKEQVQYLEQSLQLIKSGARTEEIARAQGSLQQVEGQLAFARSQLEATIIRAPISGTILERTAEKGELITAQFASGAEDGPQGSVVAIADLHDLRVSLDIPQTKFTQISLGQKAVIKVDAFPDRKYDGRIVEISPEADSQKSSVTVKVQIIRPNSRLRPQMNATVELPSSTGKAEPLPAGATFLPANAVFERENRQWVVIAANEVAHLREIQIVRPGPQVLALGLQSGEKVVVSAPQSLKEGDKLQER